MTQRIPENFSAAEWKLVTIMGNTMPPRDPNDDDDDETPRTKTTTPNRTTSASRRSSENPTKTNRREGSCNSSPAFPRSELHDWLR